MATPPTYLHWTFAADAPVEAQRKVSLTEAAQSLNKVLSAVQNRGEGPSETTLPPRSKPGKQGSSWLLIVPDGEDGRRLARLLEPLSTHRGLDIPLVFMPPPAPGKHASSNTISAFFDTAIQESAPPAASIERWLQKPDTRSRLTAARDILLAGDLPLALARALSLSHNVGILNLGPEALALPEAQNPYRCYATRVAQPRPVVNPRPVVIYASQHDPFTKAAASCVVEPVQKLLEPTNRPTRVLDPFADAATIPEALSEQAGGIFLAACHGKEVYLSNRGKAPASHQGTLVDCFGEAIEPEAWANGPRLPGGVAILYACCGGATPAERRAGALVSGLNAPEADQLTVASQRWLANPQGPLAIVAHMDLVLELGVTDARDTSVYGPDHPGAAATREMITDIIDGQPLGESLANMRFVAAHAANRLIDSLLSYQQQSLEAKANGENHTPEPEWIVRWAHLVDAGGWMILGDPAVRLE